MRPEIQTPEQVILSDLLESGRMINPTLGDGDSRS